MQEWMPRYVPQATPENLVLRPEIANRDINALRPRASFKILDCLCLEALHSMELMTSIRKTFVISVPCDFFPCESFLSLGKISELDPTPCHAFGWIDQHRAGTTRS